MALLQVKGLSHYFQGLKAVSDFNLELHPGGLMGLIGPNGAGKTTVFNLITGIYRPACGEIRLNGKNLVGLMPNEITSSGLARTFQSIHLFNDMTVLDNVRVAFYHRTRYGILSALLRTRRQRKEDATLTEKAFALLSAFGLKERYHVLARYLPYGDQRRLEIARALATEPKILLLDEPAAGMNPQEVDELAGLIRWVQERFGLTILLIEHQMRMVMSLCHCVKVLDFGETIAEGTPREIRRDPRVLEAYLGKEQEI